MKPAIRDSEDTMSAFGRRKRALDKGLRPTLLAALAVGGLLVGAQPASAVDSGPTQSGEICMQKVFGTPVDSSNLVNCTANDIALSDVISVSPATCFEGEEFDLVATFEIDVTASNRYDAGFFFRTDGGTNARGDGSSASGTCSLSALTPGVAPSLELDGDTCGDLNSGVFQVTFTIPDVLCQAAPGTNEVRLPYCTSWHNKAGTTCAIATAANFKPDTKSKCVCNDNFTVPVLVETATVETTKTATPTSVPETGGTVAYSVKFTNNSQFVDVTITTIDDDIYGDLTTLPACDTGEPDATTPACTASGQTSCASLVGTVLQQGGDNATCMFSAFVTGDFEETVTNIAEVCGAQQGTGATVCDDAPAEVTVADVPATPTLTKTAQSFACSVDVPYQVAVINNSAIDTLTVNSLTDVPFGNIAAVQGNVISTTCGAVVGQTIAVSGTATCSFVGRITDPDCTFTHEDTVTGNVTDDDGVTSTPSDSASVSVTPVLQ